MEVRGNKELSEILAKKLFSIESVPKDVQKRMVNKAIKSAQQYHDKAIEQYENELRDKEALIVELQKRSCPLKGKAVEKQKGVKYDLDDLDYFTVA